MKNFLENTKSLSNEQTEAAESIREQFGLEKAVGYLIGEKFYTFLKDKKHLKHSTVTIEEYNELLTIFSDKIKETFTSEEIREYFYSNPRLGVLGHTMNEEEYRLFVEKGAVSPSMDTELEDALILGQVEKYLLQN